MIEPWLKTFPKLFDGKRISHEFHSGAKTEWLTVLIPQWDGLCEPPVLNYIARYLMGLGSAVLRLDCDFMKDPIWATLEPARQAAILKEDGAALGRIVTELANFKAVSFVSFSHATLMAHAALAEVKGKDLLQAIWLSPPRHFPWDKPLPASVHSLWLAGREDVALSMDIMREQDGDRLFLAGVGHDLHITGDIMKSIGVSNDLLQKVIRWQGQINAQVGWVYVAK